MNRLSPLPWRHAFTGVLLGTAVGDALGLPAENLSPTSIRKRWNGQWRMRFVLGRGMISDDTEHTLMVAQALLQHPDDPAAFQRSLGWKFRWWFAGLPGGVGLATAKACLKMWLGCPARKAALASGGSGPAMRSAIIGAYFAEDLQRRREFVSASSNLTHRGWQAQTAALAVAECVALTIQTGGSPPRDQILALLSQLCSETEWQTFLSRIQSSLAASDSVSDFVKALGLEEGVTGYALNVVSVAIYAWLRHPEDFRTTLISALECGGDTDTVGAILGAMAAVTQGEAGIPAEWRDEIREWPRSIAFIKRVALKLAQQKETQNQQGPVRYFWPGILPRNLFFLAVVLLHGFRRCFPWR